jgi:hypothetical protein
MQIGGADIPVGMTKWVSIVMLWQLYNQAVF